VRFLLILVLFLISSACAGTEIERIAAAQAFAAKKAQEAQLLYDKGLWEEAIEPADEALEEDRGCLAAVQVKARSLFQLLRINEAFTLLLTPPPGSMEFRAACLEEAASIALKLEQPTVAIRYLDQAIELFPRRADLLIQKGKAEAQSGQELAAVRSFDQALATGGDPRIILPYLAQASYVLQKYEDAARHLEKIGRKNLTAQELLLYGAIRCEQKKLEQGLDLFQAAEKKDEKLIEALFNQGQVLEAMNKVKEAMAVYQKLLDREATYPPALFQLGNLLYMEGEEEQGLALIDCAITNENDPKTKRSLESSKDKLLNPEAPEETQEEAAPGKDEPSTNEENPNSEKMEEAQEASPQIEKGNP